MFRIRLRRRTGRLLHVALHHLNAAIHHLAHLLHHSHHLLRRHWPLWHLSAILLALTRKAASVDAVPINRSVDGRPTRAPFAIMERTPDRAFAGPCKLRS